MMAFIFTSKSIPDANLELVRFRFEKSILYKYMVYSFQYVDPSVKKYFCFYESCRMIVMFLVSGFVGFCVYYNIVKIDQANMDFKTNRDRSERRVRSNGRTLHKRNGTKRTP